MQNAPIDLEDEQRTIQDAISRIAKLNDGLRSFWSKADGWAPISAAGLLSKSRLDWQASLSRSLRHWVFDGEDEVEAGDLILAWANLGSLIEGTIKLYLSVYYEDYKKGFELFKQTKAWHQKKEVLLEPDGLLLDTLLDCCQKADLLIERDLTLSRLVQARRNAIHAFKDRPIGDADELHLAIKRYLSLLRRVNGRLPYPSEEYEPDEV